MKNMAGSLEDHFCRFKSYVCCCASFRNFDVRRSSAGLFITTSSSFIYLDSNCLLSNKISESSRWYMFMFFSINSSVEEILWRTTALLFVVELFVWKFADMSSDLQNIFKVVLDLLSFNTSKLSQINNINCIAFDIKKLLLDSLPNYCLSLNKPCKFATSQNIFAIMLLTVFKCSKDNGPIYNMIQQYWQIIPFTFQWVCCNNSADDKSGFLSLVPNKMF